MPFNTVNGGTSNVFFASSKTIFPEAYKIARLNPNSLLAFEYQAAICYLAHGEKQKVKKGKISVIVSISLAPLISFLFFQIQGCPLTQ